MIIFRKQKEYSDGITKAIYRLLKIQDKIDTWGANIGEKARRTATNNRDIPRIYKTGTYHFPTIPGHEFAGEIVDVSKELDKNLIGKRAAVFPLLPCRKCPSCEIEGLALYNS